MSKSKHLTQTRKMQRRLKYGTSTYPVHPLHNDGENYASRLTPVVFQ